MKHGVFFFFFLTPLFSVLCLGPGAVRMSWPPGRGLGCWFSLLLRGPGWSSCPRAGAKGVQLRDRALTTPLGRLPVEPAGLPPRHPGASTLWLSEVTPSGSPLPFSGWRPRLSLRWFSWGSRVLGGPRMFGARIFSMPASCLAGWGCCSPHTLLNIYMEEPYEHKRDHTHRYTLKHSHWCKNRFSQTHIVLICCCFKTYFVILVRCAAQ